MAAVVFEGFEQEDFLEALGDFCSESVVEDSALDFLFAHCVIKEWGRFDFVDEVGEI